MGRKRTIGTALLLCLLVAMTPASGLGEDDLSYELANDLPTGIEEGEDDLSYELANGLPTGIEEDEEELSYELAHGLSTGIEEDEEELSYELAHGLPTGIEEDEEELSYELAHGLPTGIEELYAYVNTANGKGLNLRAKANTNGKVIATIPYGARVLVTGYYSSSWAAVTYGNHNGYCMTRYLTDAKPHSAAATGYASVPAASASEDLRTIFAGFQSASYAAMVVPSTPTGYVNLRWAPTKSAPTHAVYRAGDLVAVLATGNGWSQLYDEDTGTAGFMMSQFLTRIQEYGTAGSTMK